eukprot:scaffold16613_cov101-Isochrysis_galbana.AAC.3
MPAQVGIGGSLGAWAGRDGQRGAGWLVVTASEQGWAGRTVRMLHGCPKRTASSWICTASSRVGASTSASGPSPSLSMG